MSNRFDADNPDSTTGKELKQQLLRQQVRDLRKRAETGLYEMWRSELGARFDEAVTSRQATLNLINDPNPKVRQAAFGLLRRHWPPDPALEDSYRRSISLDPDHGVSCAAVWCLSTLHRGTSHSDSSILLARIARDGGMPGILRRTAYLGLFEVLGLRMPLDVQMKLSNSKAAFPEDLDWSVVDSIIDQTYDPKGRRL